MEASEGAYRPHEDERVDEQDEFNREALHVGKRLAGAQQLQVRAPALRAGELPQASERDGEPRTRATTQGKYS